MWGPLCSYFCNHPDIKQFEKVKTISSVKRYTVRVLASSFLIAVLPMLEKLKMFFQTSLDATIHIVLGESE